MAAGTSTSPRPRGSRTSEDDATRSARGIRPRHPERHTDDTVSSASAADNAASTAGRLTVYSSSNTSTDTAFSVAGDLGATADNNHGSTSSATDNDLSAANRSKYRDAHPNTITNEWSPPPTHALHPLAEAAMTARVLPQPPTFTTSITAVIQRTVTPSSAQPSLQDLVTKDDEDCRIVE